MNAGVFGVTEEARSNQIARAERFEQGIVQQERLRNANLLAFAAYSRQQIIFNPALRGMLSNFTGPTLFYIGGQDAETLRSLEVSQGRRLVDYFVDPTFVEIPGGLGHVETEQRSDLVIPYVLRFLEQT